MLNISASVYAEKPQKDIHSFVGTFTRVSCGHCTCTWYSSVLKDFIFHVITTKKLDFFGLKCYKYVHAWQKDVQ